MKITRYPQSCLLLSHEGRQIVIDPGSDFLATRQHTELDMVEAVLYTHKHSDHVDPEIADYLGSKGAQLIGNRETAEMLGDRELRIVEDGESFEVAGFAVVARELPHCLLPDGSAGPQNTGYIINGTFFHPGDGIELAGLEVESMALPIQGPDISMKDAFRFAKSLKVKQAIPIHYDKMGADPAVFAAFAKRFEMPFTLHVLADGESLEL
ncbi:MBL fold metallo-hydrolase [Candidatus Saccharibacteria bacterium]|nr:MBL fold metallo-hydrolase [Candidatus Saccharibacteria bacterium]